jgi:LPS-assembly protein
MRLDLMSIDGGLLHLARRCAFGGGVCLLLAGTALLTAHDASAQSSQKSTKMPFGTGLQQTAPVDPKNQPLLLQADELINDTKHNRVMAKGHVEVYYSNYVLLCDELVYDKTAKTLDAIGNVRMKEPDNSTINADRMTLTEDFRDGFVRSLRTVTKGEERIASSSAYRKDGDTVVFKDAVYTPCKACADDPSRPPIWRIKAREAMSVKSEQNVYFKDAQLELFGMPSIWVPYFYMPDPTVARRSGLLAPSYISSSTLGFGIQTPYYFALAPSYDLTLTPQYTTKAGQMISGEWRQRLETGAYRVRFYGAYNEEPAIDSTTGLRTDKFRGSIDTAGAFAINKFWIAGWDGTLDSDDTFRRYYKITDIYATDEISKVFLIGQGDRSFIAAQVMHFGNLASSLPGYKPAPGTTAAMHSEALPWVDYSYVFGKPVVGGELSVNANALNLLSTPAGSSHTSNTQRVATDLRWRKSFVDPVGEIFTPFLYARGDAYNIANYADPVTSNETNTSLTRGTVAAGMEYRYPFVKQMENGSQVIEPIAQIIARPDKVVNSKIPNQDSQSLVFDDTLLFDINKFSGYDRIESGTRVNSGIQYSIQTNSGWSFRTLAGESFQIAGQNSYVADSGLGRNESDYVAGFYVEMPKYLRFVSQSRFDQRDQTLKREDIQVIGDLGPFYATTAYSQAKAQPQLGFTDDRQEVSGLAALRLSNFWTAYGTARYDIKGDQMVADTVGLRYADECFLMSVYWNDQYVKDGIITPDHTLMVKFDLLGAGGTNVTTDPIRALSPDATLIR